MFYCSNCKSTDVELTISLAWVKQDKDGTLFMDQEINTDMIDKDTGWCNNCGDNVDIKEITMKTKLLVATAVSVLALGSQAAFFGAGHNWNGGSSAAKAGKPVGITKGVMEVAGISRNQDNANTVNPAFAKTSRPCPPFCIQPTAPFAPAAVATVTELDVINAAKAIAGGDSSQMIVDARTPGWAKKGTIPHAVNVPFTKLNSKALAKDPMAVVEILTDQEVLEWAKEVIKREY